MHRLNGKGRGVRGEGRGSEPASLVRRPLRLAAPLFALAFACALPFPAAATSLYPGSIVNGQSYYSEMKGHRVGDVVTVVIVERATASNAASTQNKKSTKLFAGAGTGALKFIDSLGTNTESNIQGDGETSTVTSLQTRITARVQKVLPNGNLVIEGKRVNQINNETQHIYLKGIVRPVDITSENTVLSTALADAEIHLTGRGPGAQATRPGPIQRVFDWVF